MSLQQTAIDLLIKQGEAVLLTFPDTVPEFDPVTGAEQAGTAGDSVNLFGYLSAYKAHEMDGSAIQAGDIKLIAPALAVRPVTGCSVVADGETYRAQSVNAVRQAGADVITIIQLRRN
jgi:hypothetical protein